MKIRPVVVIPNYNHHQKIRQVLEKLQPFVLPVIIVDDGSVHETQIILQQVATEFAHVTLLRLPHNQGKGAAVAHGILHAQQLGYTHVIQVDADGQHAIDDIPKLLAISDAEPDALVSAQPIYDDSVPRARLYSRYLTHVWVWIETLSFIITDSMCGFRVYPIASSAKLIQQTSLGKRMDFDTEIMVRLYWRGVPIRMVKSKVTYPSDGISHFNLWRDNWLITKMHTRLFFGMLWRLPVLLWRRVHKTNQKQHWSVESERGASWGMKTILFVYRWFGYPLAKIFLVPVVSYFYLTGKRARAASRDYLARVEQFARTQGIDNRYSTAWMSYRHFLAFGESSLDKISAWMGKLNHSHVVFHNRDQWMDMLIQKQGAVVLGSHLGNLEMCRALADSVPDLKLKVLVHTKHAEKFNRMLRSVSPNVPVGLIQVTELSPAHAIELQECIQRGEFVVVVGDRTSTTVAGRVVQAPFLGKVANFPEGPYILAGLMRCPVYTLFSIKEGNIYNVYFEHFADSLAFGSRERKQGVQNAVERFAQRLEKYCVKAPLQWFNFFDFWQTTATTKLNTVSGLNENDNNATAK